MSKAKNRKELPGLKVEITTKLGTAANRRAWDRFWERLLAGQREAKNGQQKMG